MEAVETVTIPDLTDALLSYGVETGSQVVSEGHDVGIVVLSHYTTPPLHHLHVLSRINQHWLSLSGSATDGIC